MRKNKYINGMVSCLIPCYNASKYLMECIDSILKQTYKKLEVIFVDDGSTDTTFTILNESKKKLEESGAIVHVARHNHNKGISAGINTAIGYVQGEYLTWFDSDDILDEKCIEKKVNFLMKNKDYECVMGCGVVFENNNINDVVHKFGCESRIGVDFENYLMQYCATSPGLNMVYSKALFDILPDRGLPEDVTEQNWYLMLLIAAKYRIGRIDDVVYYYRLNNESDSHKNKCLTGLDYKKYLDSVDLVRYHAINDCALTMIEKNREYILQNKKSIIDRVNTIDDELIMMENKYASLVLQMFLEQSNIQNFSFERKIYIWGTSDRQKRLRKILEKHIKIEGFIDSNISDETNEIINANDIDKRNIFIIITLEYHVQIVKILLEKGFRMNIDYYYPKYEIYKSILDNAEVMLYD